VIYWDYFRKNICRPSFTGITLEKIYAGPPRGKGSENW